MREIQLSFISNQSTIRWFKLLNFIERNRTFTIGGLADENNVSHRTIANDIRYLKEHFVDSAVFVSGSNGFTFEEIDRSLYREQKKMLLENEILFEIVENIFYGRLERIDELAHFYNYSESTFRRLLSKCTSLLNSYSLKWASNPLKLSGDEACLRKFFKDFFYEGIETPYSVIPDPKLVHLVMTTVGGSLDINTYEIASGTTPTAFYYTLFIAIKRYQQGNTMSLPNQLMKKVYTESDFLLLYSLEEGIYDVFGVHLPKEEFAWVYLITVCNRTFNYERFEKNFYDRFNLWPRITEITENYLEFLEIDSATHAKLVPFIRSFFLSIKIKDTIEPVLNKAMLETLLGIDGAEAISFDRNLAFLQREKHQFSISNQYIRDICTSLTVYSNLLVDYYTPPKKIFFLLEGNHLAYQFIRIKAIELFGTKHSLVFVPIQALSPEKLKKTKVDLIVTNYNRYVSDFISTSDYLLIQEMPDEQDWRNIAHKLKNK